MSGFSYNSPQWRRFRSSVLAARPICEAPGCGRRSTDVHHRQTVRSGGAPFAQANVETLCHSCHSRHTAANDGGFGNKLRRRGHLGVPGFRADGTPNDPNHHWNTGRRR